MSGAAARTGNFIIIVRKYLQKNGENRYCTKITIHVRSGDKAILDRILGDTCEDIMLG